MNPKYMDKHEDFLNSSLLELIDKSLLILKFELHNSSDLFSPVSSNPHFFKILSIFPILHDLICNNRNIFAHVGILLLQRISFASSVIENEPLLFNDIIFLSFNVASESNNFPTPSLFNSEFSRLVSLNVPFSLIAKCRISKSIVPNFLISLTILQDLSFFALEEYMWIILN